MQATKETILTSSCSVFVLSFLCQVIFIFQGLDVTDTGFHLTNQMEAFSSRVDPARIYPMIFLTDFFGGMWLNIIHGPSLLWARIGGVILYSLNAVLIYSILSSYFPRSRVFMTVLVCSFFVTMRPGINIIDYYTFPAFLLNILAWLIHKRLQVPSGASRAGLFEFFIGFMAVPVVLSRMSLVLIVLLPVVMLLYQLLTRRCTEKPVQVIKLISLGGVCSVILFGILYWTQGMFDGGFFNLLAGKTSSIAPDHATHNASRMLSLYGKQIQVIAELTGYIILGLYILSLVGLKLSRSVANVLITLVPMVSASYFLVQGFDIDLLAYRAIMAAAGCTAVISLLILLMEDDDNPGLAYLVITGLVIMIMTPLGAGSGFTKISHGMWLAFPLAVLCIDKAHSRIRNNQLAAMLSHTWAILVLVFALSLVFQFTNIYRDDGNRLHLKQSFSHPSLACIYSTPGRVLVVDELIAAMERYAGKNDEILIASSLPLFYYLTETKAALHNPWIIADSLGNIRKRQRQLVEEHRLPGLFIVAKVDTRSERNWPDASVDYYEPEREKLEYFKDEYIRKLRYQLLWENSAFAVYGRPADKTGVRHSQAPWRKNAIPPLRG